MKLKILNVKDKGNPALERVRLVATEDDVDLRDFIIMDNTFDLDDRKSNKYRHCYDFEPHKIKLKRKDRVVLHTCSGKNKTISNKNDEDISVYHIYWGLGHSVWNKEGDTAHLIEVWERSIKNV
ncbi:hypothetical protein [Pantoea sp. DY-17]|uniref:hypothetical protein n=1 Tax=Pantoea sp. DY-17 TaxID=2871490 RepID=UPI001C960F12|nr:hypothetical protein [Pantoea sp. DY-17]MBY4951223.1 hypothetical protein [Pantoea sp. DY-17]